MDFKDVVSVTAYITDFKDFDKFNAAYREYFPTDPRREPTRPDGCAEYSAHGSSYR